MPRPTATLFRLSTASLCESQCTQPILWLRDIADNAELSSLAKIGILGACALIFLLLVILLARFLLRRRAPRRAGYNELGKFVALVAIIPSALVRLPVAFHQLDVSFA